ncbi:MAG: hypothetical protein HOL85_02995 [Rhodospirillaceae bacterium]|jgi:hemerythrin|nr:hypothetical protein [Rhodospirillaceae bacterium]MBT6136222.1 hypothetical protein [Rhodospirillaceae bacterium]
MQQLTQRLEDLSVGNEVLDADHRSIHAATARLAACTTETELRHHLSTVLELSKIHFRREEKYMQVARFPHAKIHAGQHARFLNTLRHYHNVTEPGFLLLIKPDLEEFLDGWLIDHVLSADKAYQSYMIRSAPELAALAREARSAAQQAQ